MNILPSTAWEPSEKKLTSKSNIHKEIYYRPTINGVMFMVSTEANMLLKTYKPSAKQKSETHLNIPCHQSHWTNI